MKGIHMSHEIEIVDGQANLAYTGEVPWHGLGTRVENVMTAEQAIDLAGLNWSVDLVPVFAEYDGQMQEIPRVRSVQRDRDGKSLGIVSKDYKPVQNSVGFTFFDNLVDSGEAKYEVAGSLMGGKRVFMTAKVGEGITIGGSDAYDTYLLLINDHSGTKALSCVSTVVRVVCQNTATLALKKAKTSWTLNHRQDLDGRVVEAREALNLSFKYQKEFEAEMEALLAVDMTKDKFKSIVEGILPDQKFATDKKVNALIDIYANSETIGDEYRNTGYGAYNAITEFVSHSAKRSQEARMIYNTSGSGASLRNDAFSAILASA